MGECWKELLISVAAVRLGALAVSTCLRRQRFGRGTSLGCRPTLRPCQLLGRMMQLPSFSNRGGT